MGRFRVSRQEERDHQEEKNGMTGRIQMGNEMRRQGRERGREFGRLSEIQGWGKRCGRRWGRDEQGAAG